MAEVIRIICVLCCFLIVFGKENYQVTVSYNATVTINCSVTSVKKILNITVNENSKCKPMDCILSEEEENATKSSCDEQHTCNITSNIPNSCLLDLGYLNYKYRCKVIAHSCNFDNGGCDWTILPDTDDKFRWKRKHGTTSTGGTGPLSDHTTGSGYYAYTEASRGSNGDFAKLKSVGITSSPYQCLSFWYHMRGDDIGSLRVYQIFSTQDKVMPIWTVDGEQGKGWIYQAINLTYKNDFFEIMFEGVRGDDNEGDIALDDIKITNSYFISFSCNFDDDWCDLTISPDTDDEFRWKQGHGATSSSGTGPSGDHFTGSGYYAYTEASRGSNGDFAKLKSVAITSSPYQCLSFWYHMHGEDIGALRVYQIYSAQDEDMPIWTVDGEQGNGWIYQAINLTYKNDLFKIMFEGVRSDGNKGDIALDDITITNSHCEDLRSRCQLSYSDQCTMNSNEEPLFEFKEECTEINQPISLSCSNQYLTVDHDEFIFDPELEFCHDIYMSSKSSLCNNTSDSEICTFNLHRIKQRYPECFSRYSMTIDYTCVANLHEKMKNSIVAADVLMILVSTLVFIIVATLVIIALVCYRNKRAKHLKTQQNTTTIQSIDVCDYDVINYNAMTDISIIRIHEKGNETDTTQHHLQNIKTLIKQDQNICTKYDSLSTDRNSVDHFYESCSIHKNQYESLTNQRESDNHTYESPEYKLQRDINTLIEQETTIGNKYETLSHNQTSVEHTYEPGLIHTNQYEALTRQRESDKHTYESTEPAQAQDIKTVVQNDQNVCDKYESISINRNSDKHIDESNSIHTNRYESFTIPRELYKHTYEPTDHSLPQDKKTSIE